VVLPEEGDGEAGTAGEAVCTGEGATGGEAGVEVVQEPVTHHSDDSLQVSPDAQL